MPSVANTPTLQWSLRAALSEPVSVTVGDPPVQQTILVESTSRMLAFAGMIVVILEITVFGGIAAWQFATNSTADISKNLGSVTTYITATAGLFVPYVFNKVAGAIAGR